MGGEDRDPRAIMSKAGSGKVPRHEDISDAIISKLLKDFTSAELFPQSGDGHCSKASSAKNDCAWNEVVASFKHLHVRHPGFKKLRRAKKHSQDRKGSVNLLNLAIAAGNLHRPIVWPSRLNCDCKKSSASLLNPSKLKVCGNNSTCSLRDLSGLQSKGVALGGACLLCKDKFSKGHVTNKQHVPNALFGHTSNVSNLSFNGLCHQQSFSKTLNVEENVCRLKQENAVGCKTEFACTSSNTTSNRQQHHSFFGQQLFTNVPLKPLPSSDLPCSLGSPIQHLPSATNIGDSAVYVRPSATVTSLTTVGPVALCSSSSARPCHPSQPTTSAQHTLSSAAAAGVGRSCSQEVRDMEDTNVNELASYLEDLLHIPRKMSTMAEMMYA